MEILSGASRYKECSRQASVGLQSEEGTLSRSAGLECIIAVLGMRPRDRAETIYTKMFNKGFGTSPLL